MQSKIKPDTKFFNTDIAVEKYSKSVLDVRVWESEKIIFEKYATINSKIIDIGCGAGRTTFSLFRLGYNNIIGIDISEKLLEKALHYNQLLNTNIIFLNMDIVKTNFEDSTFDIAFFSYNGLTGIPTERRRLSILKEIYRILKFGGFFIFCAHDRDDDPNSKDFWLHEHRRWKEGKNNPILYEYGDVLVNQGASYEFLHYYNHDEMINFIHKTDFRIINSFKRRELATEPYNVQKFAKDTCFWVLQK